MKKNLPVNHSGNILELFHERVGHQVIEETFTQLITVAPKGLESLMLVLHEYNY